MSQKYKFTITEAGTNPPSAELVTSPSNYIPSLKAWLFDFVADGKLEIAHAQTMLNLAVSVLPQTTFIRVELRDGPTLYLCDHPGE